VTAFPRNSGAQTRVSQPTDKVDGVRTSLVDAGRRRWEAICAAWPSGAPGYALLGLLITGVALRLIAIVSWWPTTTTLDDGYELYVSNPFTNPYHPAGYSLLLGALGLVTREIAVPILLQHLSGIASALLLWAATRRVTGSAWAGLVPAAIVLLGADLIYLEHAIMSESWAVLGISLGLYAAVRAFDQPEPWWRWPLLAGSALALAVTIRTAALFMIPVAALAVLLCQPMWVGRRPAYRLAAGSVIGSAAAILLVFATANAMFGDRFGLGPSPGWLLYARAAEFADCRRFTPPAGTEVLCEDRPPSERPGMPYYQSDPSSPAVRHFGPYGEHDSLLGQWARRAILAQPGDYLRHAWVYLRGYWFPDAGPDQSAGLDPQLAFTNGLPDSGFYPVLGVALLEAGFEQSLETYYDDFTVHEYRPGLEFLRSWQTVVRFGATLLSITTILVLFGFVVGTRRSRVGVLLFGIGGLSLIVLPALGGAYTGRYTVPMAGPMMAGAAITIIELWRTFKSRKRQAAGRRTAAVDGRS
jgi:Dolichyl-phosphate-mannose-protein mannosyltransferase